MYLGIIFWLQPSDRLGDPDKAPWLGRLAYDDFDLTAMALRGLNDALGRSAGDTADPSDRERSDDLSEELKRDRPLKPHYFLEYPHAALWIFRLGWRVQRVPTDVPTAVCDADHPSIVWHVPRNDDERELWHRFRVAIRTYQVMMIGCLLALMAVLRLGYEPAGRLGGPVALLLLPASQYFAANRFDIVPALLVALSLACLGRRRVVASAVLLAAATMVKVYPVLLVPLVVRYVSDNRKAAAARTAAYGLAAVALLLPPLLRFGWESTWAPYHFQLSREYDPLSMGTLYGCVLPEALGGHGLGARLFRTGSVLLTALALSWSRPADLGSVLRRSAVVLVVFVSVQVFYSPQWILWLCPFLIPLARLDRWVLGLTVALDLVTFVTFPIVFDAGMSADALVYVRVLILAALVVVLLRAEFGRKSLAPAECAAHCPTVA